MRLTPRTSTASALQEAAMEWLWLLWMAYENAMKLWLMYMASVMIREAMPACLAAARRLHRAASMACMQVSIYFS